MWMSAVSAVTLQSDAWLRYAPVCAAVQQPLHVGMSAVMEACQSHSEMVCSKLEEHISCSKQYLFR